MMGMATSYSEYDTSVESNYWPEFKEVDIARIEFLFSLEIDYQLTREWFEHHMEILLKSIFNVWYPFFHPQ